MKTKRVTRRGGTRKKRGSKLDTVEEEGVKSKARVEPEIHIPITRQIGEDPMVFVADTLNRIYRELPAPGYTDSCREFAKDLLLYAVRLYYESQYTLELDGVHTETRGTGVERSKIQKDYVKHKRQHFRQPGVQAVLRTLADFEEESVRTDTTGRGIFITNQDTGSHMCHEQQVACVRRAFQTNSEIRAELMPHVLTDILLQTLYKDLQSNSGEFMATQFNRDHGFLTRQEPLFKKTVSLRMAMIAGGAMGKIFQSEACRDYLVHLQEEILQDRLTKDQIEKGFEEDIIHANSQVIDWTQKLAIAVALKKSEQVASSSVMSRARSGTNSRRVVMGATGLQSAYDIVRQHITSQFLEEHLYGERQARDKEMLRSVVFHIDSEDPIDSSHIVKVFKHRIKVDFKRVHPSQATFIKLLQGRIEMLHHTLDEMYHQEFEKLRLSRVDSKYRPAAEVFSKEELGNVGSRVAAAGALLSMGSYRGNIHPYENHSDHELPSPGFQTPLKSRSHTSTPNSAISNVPSSHSSQYSYTSQDERNLAEAIRRSEEARKAAENAEIAASQLKSIIKSRSRKKGK